MRGTHDAVNLNRRHRPLPGMGALRRGATDADLEVVRCALQARVGGVGAVIEPGSFVQTAAPPSGGGSNPGFKVPQKRGR